METRGEALNPLSYQLVPELGLQPISLTTELFEPPERCQEVRCLSSNHLSPGLYEALSGV